MEDEERDLGEDCLEESVNLGSENLLLLKGLMWWLL